MIWSIFKGTCHCFLLSEGTKNMILTLCFSQIPSLDQIALSTRDKNQNLTIFQIFVFSILMRPRIKNETFANQKKNQKKRKNPKP